MNNLLAAAVVILQVLSGLVIWVAISGSLIRNLFLTLGIGAALGTFLSMIVSVLLQETPVATVAWAIPFMASIILVVARRKAFICFFGKATVTRAELVALAITLSIAGLLLIVSWIRRPLSAIRSGESVDMYFLEALSNGISRLGPDQSILMSGGSLRYHWFVYGWAGELTSTTGLDNFVALTRILPIVSLLGASLIAIGWAASLTFGDRPSPVWVPALAGILVTVGGYTGALYGVILNFDSPSQALTTVWLLAVSALTTAYFAHDTRHFSKVQNVFVLGVIGILVFALIGGKASSGLVVLGALSFCVLISAIFHAPWTKRAILTTTVAFLAAATCYLWVLSGIAIDENLTESVAVKASTWQNLDPIAGRWATWMGTFALIMAVSTRIIGMTWFFESREKFARPAIVFVTGAMLTGFAALILLSDGINELWFVLAASAPTSIIAAYGVGQAFQRLEIPLWLPIVVALPASALSLILSWNWRIADNLNDNSFFKMPGLLYWLSIVLVWIVIPILSFLVLRMKHYNPEIRNLVTATCGLSIIALTLTSILTRPAVLWTQTRVLTTEIGLVKPQANFEDSNIQSASGSDVIDDQLAAALWLQENSKVTDLIATSNPGSSFIPALTGRQMYIAGYLYQIGLGASSEAETVEQRAASSSLLASGELGAISQDLCTQDIDWFWIENSNENLLGRQPAYTSKNVSVYSSQSLCSLEN